MEEPLAGRDAAPTPGSSWEPAASAPSDQPAAPEPRSAWRLVLKIVSIGLVAGVLGLLAWATLAAGRGSSLVAKIGAGKAPAAPGFNLGVIWPHTETWPPAVRAAITDGKLSVAELRGHPTVINFWASWCIPCRDEAPILRAGALRHHGQVAFVGIDVRDLTGDALGFARKYKVNYVSVRDGGGDKTWNSYGLTGVPETYFLDARGRILAHAPGAISTRTLQEGITTITQGAAKPRTLRGGAHITP